MKSEDRSSIRFSFNQSKMDASVEFQSTVCSYLPESIGKLITCLNARLINFAMPNIFDSLYYSLLLSNIQFTKIAK